MGKTPLATKSTLLIYAVTLKIKIAVASTNSLLGVRNLPAAYQLSPLNTTSVHQTDHSDSGRFQGQDNVNHSLVLKYKNSQCFVSQIFRNKTSNAT